MAGLVDDGGPSTDGRAFYNLYILYDSRREEVHAQAFRQSQLIALEIARVVSGMESVLLTVASAPAVKDFEIDRCNAFLSQTADRLAGVAAIGLLDKSGTVRCRNAAAGLGISLADRPYFREAMKTGQLVVGDYTKSRIDGKTVLPMAIPLIDAQGLASGVLALSVDLDWLQGLLTQRQFEAGSAITIADRHGVILARYPDPRRFVGTTIPDQYQYLVNAAAAGTIELTSQDGTRRVLAYFPVDSIAKGLYVSSGKSVQTSFYSIERAAIFGFLATIVIMAFTLALAWQTSRYAIELPVRRILAALAAWRNGESEVRTSMQSGKDEFSEIGSAIDTFMDELTESRRQKQLLEDEMGHRIKNLMAMIQSVASRTFTDQRPRSEALQIFSHRLRSMIDAFTVLGSGVQTAADLRSLVVSAIQPFDNPEKTPFSVAGPVLEVNSKAALSISMALHELCTNAVKYGALSKDGGAVAISWGVRAEDNMLVFSWEERGGPEVTPPAKSGFGSLMIQTALASQTNGEVDTQFAPTGLKFRLTAPLSELAES
ncbi:sensor histidine kinase [Rhizobium sp. G21]|uniref:sensor histidine kinase n=1 Tax=Rhizobium sp. G21 TaxID=2758439 RepID=UPI0028A95D77|nr:sensor histidine kinase [Rhizobium sp. G21]